LDLLGDIGFVIHQLCPRLQLTILLRPVFPM
jgi:hypothetical protein